MVERSGSHKKLKGLSALGASALFIAACSTGDATPSSSFVPENTPKNTPELVTPKPTQIIKETPKPTEILLSMEQQASNIIFDYWFSLLNTTQKADMGNNVFYLKTEIIDFDKWKHNIDIIKNGGTADAPLIVKWIGGEIYYKTDALTEAKGIKSQGIMQIENIGLSTLSKPLTNEEKSQGITGSYETALGFDVSYAENEYKPTSSTPYANPESVEEWLFTQETDPYWPLSSSNRMELTNFRTIFKNNQWENLNTNDLTSTTIGDPLAFLSKPMFLMGEPVFCQDPNVSSSCQLIVKNINY